MHSGTYFWCSPPMERVQAEAWTGIAGTDFLLVRQVVNLPTLVVTPRPHELHTGIASIS